MPAPRLTGIALWGAWLAAGPAAGQEAPIVDDSAMVVEIVAESPRRTSADPKTELRLTGEELAKQGVANLAEALELLPEVATHENRRGGMPVDIRGARQRAVMVIIDGVPVDEPWRGLFDLTSIPVTEIVELRVSTSPASPLDGAGGSGGVVEIATLRARGGRMLAGQARGSDAPELQLGATGRVDLSRYFAVRVSLGGIANERTHDAIMPPPDNSVRKLDENRRAGYVSARVEGERGRARLIADLFGQHRSYLVPPDDETPTAVSVVDGEDSFRGVLGGDVDTGPWLLVARGYGQVLRRSSTSYPDASLMTESGDEELAADREGGMVEAERLIFPGPNVDSPPLRVGARLALDSEQARVESTAGGISNVDHGRSTVVQGATGAVWSVAGVTLDAAFGVAVPLVGDADPWPEAKLTVSYAPIAGLGLQAIGARKGRLPTLRERFDPLGGNPDLGPERISFTSRGSRGSWPSTNATRRASSAPPRPLRA